MKEKIIKEVEVETTARPTMIDLMRSIGGVAHPVRTPKGRAVDSMLAVYKDKLTYTFILANEVSSIHFDRSRGEIFLKGHNIKQLELSQNERKALEDLKIVLVEDDDGRRLLNDYVATLTHILADKY